jgi:A/G-specific adenine glycosylase
MPESTALPKITRSLLAWFRRGRRDLPWRRTRDPYAIWVSEVMLQQTQVATVVPYYERFLRAFPDVQALAAAEEQEVLRLWEGLGYYRRARDLHRAARILAADHRAICPDDPEVWRDLPGIGRYTLGAVLSQAFDRRLPILEANSVRVLCRLLGEESDPRSGPVRRRLWQVAEQLLPRRHVGEFNQALMELGSQVCKPAAPDCAACPIRRACQAHRSRMQDRIPLRAPPPTVEEVREVALLVRRASQVLLAQRPAQGRWAGLWELPRGPVETGETPQTAARRLLPALTGVRARVGTELLSIRHGVTRFRITLTCLECVYRSGRFASDVYTRGLWLKPAELRDFPVSSPQRRLIERIVSSV